MLLFFLAGSVLTVSVAARVYLVTWIGERVVADVRKAVFAKVLRLEPAFFEVTRTGEVISRLTVDTSLLQVVVGSTLAIAVRNALLPAVTLVGLNLPFLLGGAVVTETVFNWPGMGRLAFQSTLDRDLPVLVVIAFLSVLMVRVGMLLKSVLLLMPITVALQGLSMFLRSLQALRGR